MRVSAMVNCVLLGAILLLISAGSCIAVNKPLYDCLSSMGNVTCEEENITFVFTIRASTSKEISLALLLAKYHGNKMVITWNTTEEIGYLFMSYVGRHDPDRGIVTLSKFGLEFERMKASSTVEEFFKFTSLLLPSKAQYISSLVTQKDGHFIPLSSLEFILQSLKYTKIQWLEIPGCIEGRPTLPFRLTMMPELQYIDISNNGIEELLVENLFSMPNLQHIILKNNSFDEIPRALGGVQGVKYLDISHNHRTLQYHNLLLINSSLQNLEVLEMSNNRYNFSLKDFSALESLKELYVGGCLMYYTFDNNTFQKFSRLRKLNISNLTTNFDMVLTLPNLTLLDISRNNITNLPKFHSLNVTHIDASHNSIRSLDELSLEIDSVKYLDVSHNNITEWWSKEPRYWNGLVEVNLRNNNIEMLLEKMRKSLNHVQKLYLGENPFDCNNCETREFQFWLDTSQEKVNDFGDVKCEPNFNISVLYFTAYDLSCIEKSKVPNIWLAVGIPVGGILLSVILSMFFRRRHNRNRAKLEYVKYLDGIMNYPEESYSTKKHEYIYDVFVCYSHENRKFVWKTLVPFLESGQERFRACLHERDFPLGTDIIDNIVRAVEGSRNILMIVSNAFVRSKWCKYELKLTNHIMVEEKASPLILVQIEPLDGVTIPQHLKQHMLTKTYLEWPKDDRNTGRVKYKRLKSALSPSLYQQSKDRSEVSVPPERNDLELVPLYNAAE